MTSSPARAEHGGGTINTAALLLLLLLLLSKLVYCQLVGVCSYYMDGAVQWLDNTAPGICAGRYCWILKNYYCCSSNALIRNMMTGWIEFLCYTCPYISGQSDKLLRYMYVTLYDFRIPYTALTRNIMTF